MLSARKVLVQFAIAAIATAGPALAEICPSTNDLSLAGSGATYCVESSGTVDDRFNPAIGTDPQDNLTPLWQNTSSDSNQTLALERVPEPDTLSLILMGSGLCLFSFCRRKTR